MESLTDQIISNFIFNFVQLFSKRLITEDDLQNLEQKIKEKYQYFISSKDQDKIHKIEQGDSSSVIQNKIIYYIYGIGKECLYDSITDILVILGYQPETLEDEPVYSSIQEQFILLFICLYFQKNDFWR